MNGRLRKLATLASAGALTVIAAPVAVALGAEVQTPLPASNYAIRAACATPAPGQAGCLAVQLVPVSAQARHHQRPIGISRPLGAALPAARSPAAGDFGLRPQDLRKAYELPETGRGLQTIALVDAYNDPTAEADLAAYSAMFDLPACTKSTGCFKQVGETGSASALPFPGSTEELEAAEAGGEEAKALAENARGWDVEISLDIETAHAVCPGCQIMLVEAEGASYSSLERAERTAETLGAGVISNSWGGSEEGVSPEQDAASPFNDPQVVITAATGDDGYHGWDARSAGEKGYTDYPAASPHVVAVGGTRLATLGLGGAWSGEAVWNGAGATGGGCSRRFSAPEWQLQLPDWASIGCATKRVVADVSADADPYTGVAITDSSPACESETGEGAGHTIHWCTYGGTSLASPIIAGVFALAGGANGVAYPARTLYESERLDPSALHDVTVGSSGQCSAGYSSSGLARCTPAEEAAASCESKGSCLAGTGFDGPSGVGTPHGILGFEPGESAGSEPPAAEPPAEAPGKEKESKESKLESLPGSKGSSVTPTAPSEPTRPPTPKPPRAPVLSALSLTSDALIALDSRRPSSAAVSFAFSLSTPTTVHIELARRVRARHGARWVAVGPAASLAAAAGRNDSRAGGRSPLPQGLYRLTVTPLGGRPRSIRFHIG